MKKMILFFSLAVFALVSCKNGKSSKDQLIGTWTKHQSFGNDMEEPLEACDKKDQFVVLADGTFTETLYYDNDGSCELDEEKISTWKSLGNGIYRITSGTDDYYDMTVTFEDNTLIIEDSETSNGETYTYKEVYLKN